MATLVVIKSPSSELALRNVVYVSPEDASVLENPTGATSTTTKNHVRINDYIYMYQPHRAVKAGTVALSGLQRTNCYVSLNEPVDVEPFRVDWDEAALGHMTIEMALLNAGLGEVTVRADDVHGVLTRGYLNQFFRPGQRFAVDLHGRNMMLTVLDVQYATLEGSTGSPTAATETGTNHAPLSGGIFLQSTDITIMAGLRSGLRVEGDRSGTALS